VVRRHVDVQMPFMATERWLMRGVQAGGDRQTLHDVIRRESRAVAEAVARGGVNDLLERLSVHAGFSALSTEDLKADLDPIRYTGRAASQVGEFLEEYLNPLLRRIRPVAAAIEPVEIAV